MPPRPYSSIRDAYESLQHHKATRDALSRRDAFDQVVLRFSVSEFERSQTATRLGIDNTVPDCYIGSLLELCINVLTPVRMLVGRPVIITSGFRCTELNEAIRGSKASQHCRGEAADIRVPGMSPLVLAHAIADAGLPFDQLIHEGDWVHVSHNPSSISEQRGQVLTAGFSSGKATYSAGLPPLDDAGGAA